MTELTTDQSGDLVKGRKSRARDFEVTITGFLSMMGFEDVDGARDDFRINGVQVDACGGHESTLLVIECKMRSDFKRSPVRDAIAKHRGNAKILEAGFQSHPIYKKYRRFEYILAVKNYDIRPEDKHFANEDGPRVYIWDDDFRDYYSDLYGKIKEYAKFNLLGEMRIRPAQTKPLSIPTARVTQGGYTSYLFYIDPRALLEVAYVARRYRPNERYYQRIIDKSRLKHIARYVNDGGILPNNLIIAFSEDARKNLKFHEDKSGHYDLRQQLNQFGVSHGFLDFPRDYMSCWVIDGQHRLYSFIDVDVPSVLPVVAFENLEDYKQGKIFLDINRYQKPVNADLLWDLNGDMIPADTDGIISNIVKRLNDDRTSPLYRAIFIPSRGLRNKRHVGLGIASLSRGIRRVRLTARSTPRGISNPFFDSKDVLDQDALGGSLIEYFSVVKNVLPDDWDRSKKGFVLNKIGCDVLIRYYARIIERVRAIPDRADFKRYLIPLAKFVGTKTPAELRKLKKGASSEGGRDELLREILLFVRAELRDEQLGEDLETDSYQKALDNFEPRLKELIRIKFEKSGDDWFGGLVDEATYGRCRGRMASHGSSRSESLYTYLTLGECIKIVRDRSEVFKQVFIREGDIGFRDFPDVLAALTHINNFRKIEAHGSGVRKRHDEPLFLIHLDKLNTCMDSVSGLPRLTVEPEDSDAEDEQDSE